jgi:hypothetical protein
MTTKPKSTKARRVFGAASVQAIRHVIGVRKLQPDGDGNYRLTNEMIAEAMRFDEAASYKLPPREELEAMLQEMEEAEEPIRPLKFS